MIQDYAMSKRQQQLAKLTPSEVIEVSYLCALLEKKLISMKSPRMHAIQTFLENVIDVVPLESLGFSLAFGKPGVQEKCSKVLTEINLKSFSSKMMNKALLQVSCSQCKSLSTSEASCKACSPLKDQLSKMDSKPSKNICDKNLGELYPSKDIKSPIDALSFGRDQLTKLNQTKTKLSNKEMLKVVKEIRNNELAVCVSLLGAFMDQQEISILLTNVGKDHTDMDLSGSARIGMWALSSFKLDHIQTIMKQTNREELVVTISDYKPHLGNQGQPHQETQDSHYSSKLQFIVQGLPKVVTCNSQYVSYSLERQLSEYDKTDGNLTKWNVEEITKHWLELFKDSTLSLVAESHRTLVARWLKWALMVHNLREELAKYTTVGVVGLVNSGKSTLLNNLFQLKVSFVHSHPCFKYYTIGGCFHMHSK